MRFFKDTDGKDWSIAVNVGTVKKVKAIVGIDMAQIDGELIERFSTDPCATVDVLWVLVESQANAAGINQEQFAERLGGDSLEGAGESLLGELIDFFPSRTRPMLAAAASKGKELQAKMIEMAARKTDDPKMQAEILSRFEKSLEAAGRRFIDSLDASA